MSVYIFTYTSLQAAIKDIEHRARYLPSIIWKNNGLYGTSRINEVTHKASVHVVGQLREIIVHFVIKAPYSHHIHITYGGISEINPHCRKFKISQVSL